MENLSQTRICVEKLLPHQAHIPHELHKNSQSPEHSKKLRAAFYTSKQWPKNATIKIQIKPSTMGVQWTPLRVLESNNVPLDPLENILRDQNSDPVNAVKTVVNQRIKPITDLNIQFVDEDGDVVVDFDPGKGSWSLIGTDCLSADKSNGAQTVNYGWLDVGTITHEMGHMLGMIHESSDILLFFNNYLLKNMSR